MKSVTICLILALTMSVTACDPVERQAYNTAVSAKAFLDVFKAVHPECAASKDGVCGKFAQATAAKDALIDAAEVYCSGPAFETGGECQPPKKGTSASDQAVAKLKATIAAYNQIAKDLKGAL